MDHALVVDGVVRDVARAVLLLEGPDAVLEPGGAGHGPRAGQGLLVADIGPEHRRAVVVGVVGLGGELHGQVGQRRRGRAAATARPRWPGSRRTARSPGSGTSRAIRAASMATSKQCEGVMGATIGTGASPCRLYMAWRRSDCSVLVGRPVEGPPRWMLMTRSGSSRLTAMPTDSDLRSAPGPLVVVTPSDPPKAAPMAAPTPAISSSACTVRTPKCLCLDSSWRMSDAGVIGIGPEEQREMRLVRRGDEPPGQGGVAGDVGVDAGLERGRSDLVVDLEELGGLAEVVARLEGPGVGVEHQGAVGEALLDPPQRWLRRAGCRASSRGPGRRSSWTARRRGASPRPPWRPPW